MSRSRGWCFTVNNYTALDIDQLLDIEFDYMSIGFEKGDQGTPHIQGYVYWNNQRVFDSVKKLLPNKAHIERQKGTCKQAYEYTMKDGEYYEFGEKPEQGRITFEKMEEVMSNPKENFHLYHQYHKTYDSLIRSTRKRDKRQLLFCSIDYKYELPFDSILMDGDVSTYEDEQVIVLTNGQKFNIKNWIHGYPPKIRRGYEVIKVDPEYVIILYDDLNELSMLEKKYSLIEYGLYSPTSNSLSQKEIDTYDSPTSV